MAALPHKFTHVSGPVAKALADHVNGTNSADLLCRAGIPYPNAIAISKMSTAGVADIGALHRMGFSASDAAELAAQINAKGPH